METARRRGLRVSCDIRSRDEERKRTHENERFRIVALLASLVGYAVTHAANSSALERDYPTKSVHIVEPFGLGGGPDLLARALAPRLSELWGQPVTVENCPGAGATAGPAQVANAPADGYTLLLNTSAQAYSAAFLKNLPYDPLNDFIPVAPLTSQPYVLVAGKPAGVTTVGELIAAAKAKPGELKFGSTGPGTGTHLGIVKFNLRAGMKAVDVPPRPSDSIAKIIAGTIEGRITYVMAPISITLAHIRDGNLLPLAVTTARRSTLMPDVPTIAEAGVAGFDFPSWYGIWIRAGAATGVVAKLSKGEPMSMTQSEFARFVLSERDGAARLIGTGPG